jgi:urea transporter/murein DD-endopeptidase MepM/ murein hydrolase activator NlpD
MYKLIEKIKNKYWLQCILNSYSLMFFSLNNFFAICIATVTFFTPFVGLCGLFAIITTNGIAYTIGFNRDDIRIGLFGFNALFLGMSMGYEFTFNKPFIILFISSMLILLMITVWLKGLLANKNLPFLSFPFIISYWIVSIASSHFDNILLDESHTYVFNESIKNEASYFYQVVHSLDSMDIYPFILIFFKTLAGTFFQTSVLGGIIISVGLLYFSRISFSLSLIGFACAYFFYNLFGADVNDLDSNLLGANFIFLAIALGCFFIIPTIYSYVTVIVLTPILLLTSLALTKILAVFQLQAYSFSFSFITTIFLFALSQRLFPNFLQVVTLQYFSAEKTIYKYINSLQRFKNEHLYKVSLPFIGEFTVSQGYDGGITHLGDWGKALDFVIEDSQSNTYRIPASAREGFTTENFYCYNKELIAPYDGFVYDIINTVSDNDVGDMDTENNWGNTIIINHLNGLFSAISHVKKDSFSVFVGQHVKKGEYLGTCGNSGRSPEPHIHFQFQTEPSVGAKTFAYPISYFIERNGTELELKISEVPSEGSFIRNVLVNEVLSISFSLLPGQKLSLQKENSNETVNWEVFTDAFNRTYIYCEQTRSYAYFVNDGVMFYFTDFEGDKSSLLFKFYLAAYRQLLGYYENILVKDKVPLIHFNKKLVQFLQDFVAPFYLFTQANYTSTFSYADNSYAPQKLIISTEVEAKVMNLSFKKINFELELIDHTIKKLTIHQKNKTESYLLTID